MKKNIYLEFSTEEAELLVEVFSGYLENVNNLQLKLPGIDIDFEEAEFVADSLILLKDAVDMEIGVILQCKIAIKKVLFSLALLTANYANEENDRLNTSCIIKLLHAAQDGE